MPHVMISLRWCPYLVLGAFLDGIHNIGALEAELDHLMHNVLIKHGCIGDCVCLHHCQVAGQVQGEPRVLPADN